MNEKSEKKAPVTAIVQTYNMAGTIRDCLDTLTWVEDLLVVDDESTDDTPAIARQEYGARVLTHKRENAAAQKNWAIPRAECEWVLVVDADEAVSPRLRERIIQLLENEPGMDYYRIQRVNRYFSREIRHCGWSNDRPIRLFRKTARYENKHVHADVIVEDSSRLGFLKERLYHHPYPSFEGQIDRMNQYSAWAAADLHRRGVKPTPARFIGRPVFRFIRQYFLQLGFLDGRQGLMLCLWSAYSVALKYAKLWELNRTPDKVPAEDKPS
jgi:glycosyltransferase involved in cell wall biosynthesis